MKDYQREKEAAKIIEKAKAHIELLRRITSGYRELPCTRNEPIHFALMMFFLRFESHMDSILALEKSRDSLLVARSAVEGLVLLKWITEDIGEQESRARDYLDVQLVEIQRRIQYHEATGTMISDAHKSAIKDRLFSVSDRILPPEEFNDFMVFSEPLVKKAFYERLTGKKFSELFSDVRDSQGRQARGKEAYEKPYNYMSGYHHWNPFHLLSDMEDNELSSYGPAAPSEFALSIAAAYACLGEAAYRVSLAFHLELEDEILRLNGSFVEFASF